MLRTILSSVVVVAFAFGSLTADQGKDKQDTKDKKGQEATITKVDAKKGTVTVKMKDKEGKEVEKTFKLTEEVQMFDDNGKTVKMTDIDVFRSGDCILVVEQDGKLREMRKDNTKKTETKKSAGK